MTTQNEARQTPASAYVASSMFVLRTPLLPLINRAAADDLDRLRQAVAQPVVSEALDISAPGFSPERAMESVEGAAPKRARRRARSMRSLQRYLIRMSTRPTPFGNMAALTPLRFGDSEHLPSVVVPEATLLHLRPDMGFLHRLCDELLEDEQIRSAITWSWNVAASVVGRRAILQDARLLVHDKASSARIRATAPLLALREYAASPRSQAAIIAMISERFGADDGKAVAFVDELIRHRFLLPSLLPPATVADSLVRDFLKRLPTQTERGRAVADVLSTLPSVVGAGSGAVRAARESLSALYAGEGERVEVHAVRGGLGTLPTHVGRSIADAVEFMLRVSTGAGAGAIENEQPLRAFHTRFLETYGLSTAVPVSQVIDSVVGLGLPDHYQPTFDPSSYFTRPGKLSDYERVLLDLLTETAQTGSRVLDIDASVEERLIAATPATANRAPYPAVDVYAQLGLQNGQWRIVLNSLPVARGGASSARFLHTFPAEVREELRHASFGRALEREGILVADVSYVPSSGKAANVAVRPATVAYQATLNVGPPETAKELPVDDIYVIASADRLHLWSRAHEQELVVTEHHLLSHSGAPAILRLMVEISDWQFTPLGGFAWGPFEESRHLPRVTRRGVVLRAAEWTLLANDIPALKVDSSDGDGVVSMARVQLESWRARWQVPAEVYLVFADQRLLIDLESEFGQQEALQELLRNRHLRFQEFLPDEDNAWLTDDAGDTYLAEVVVPVTHARPVALPISHHTPSYFELADVRYPGGAWVYLELFCPPELQADLIASFARLMSESNIRAIAELWFFIRYQDRGHHLRFRARARCETCGADLMGAVAKWARGAVDAGLAGSFEFRPYRPETGRYGGPDTLPVAESLFYSEAQFVAQTLTDDASADVAFDRQRAVALLDYVACRWGLNFDERLVLSSRIAAPTDRDTIAANWFRPHREELLASVLDTEDGNEPRYALTTDLVRRMGDAYEALRVASDAHAADTSLAQNAMLPSLLHMLMNRLLEPGVLSEYDIYELWRLALSSARGRLAARDKP